MLLPFHKTKPKMFNEEKSSKEKKQMLRIMNTKHQDCSVRKNLNLGCLHRPHFPSVLFFSFLGGEGKCLFQAIILSPRLKSKCGSMITCRGWISARNNSRQSCRHWLNRGDDVKLNQMHVDHRLPIPSLPALQYLQHPPAVSALYQAHLLSPLKCQLQ